jgi:selenophosphate synthetase-related protein
MGTLESVHMLHGNAGDDETADIVAVGALPERVVDAVQDRDHAEHVREVVEDLRVTPKQC